MPRIDITAASDPRKIANMILGSFAASASATSRAMTAPPEPEPDPTPEPEPPSDGIDLHAFTRCPGCGTIIHRNWTVCQNCGAKQVG
jgi:hypothetical protein